MKLLESIILLFGLLGISTIHASIGAITSPLDGSSYSYNATVPVEIDYGQIEINQVQVNQTCGTDIYTYLFERPDTKHDFPLPGTYTGTCVYTSMSNLGYAFNTVSINSVGVITINTPTQNSILPAGSLQSVIWTYMPTPQGTVSVNVEIDCTSTSSGFGIASALSITNTIANLYLMPDMYGPACEVTVTDTATPPIYVQNVVPYNVVVQQTLTFSDPLADSVNSLSFPLLIKLSTSAITITEGVETILSCAGTNQTTTINLNINFPSSYSTYPGWAYGYCTLSTNLTSAQTYLTPADVSFYLKYDLIFTSVPTTVGSGTQFDIYMTVYPSNPDGPSTVNLLLIDDITGDLVYDFGVQAVGTLITLTMPVTVPIGKYKFSNPVNDPVYFHSTSSTATTVIGTYSFTQPTNGTSIAVPDSSLEVSWTFTPTPTQATLITFVFSCPYGGSFSTPASGTNTTISVSSQYFGIGCTITGESSTDYVPANFVTLNATQQLTLIKPVQNATYYLTSSTLPYLLTTPNTNLAYMVSSTINCSQSQTSDSSLMLATNFESTFIYPTGSYGLCTLTTTPTQEFFVPAPVDSFYLKYEMSFTDVTSPATPGKSFSFTLNASPVPTLSSVPVVALYCGSSIPVQTFFNFEIGTPYTTTLLSSVPSGSCTLNSTEDNIFGPAFAPVLVQGSITITAPTNASYVASNSTLDVEWTADPAPVSATVFNVTLICPMALPSPPATTQVTGVSTAQLNIPPQFYGQCILLVSSIDYGDGSSIVVVTQDLSIQTPTEGETVALYSSSFPVSLVTSGGNVVLPILANFSCDHGTNVTSVFISNSPSTSQLVTDQFGLCSIKIDTTNLFDFLVVTDDTVYFLLKLGLNFSTLPTNLYPNQTFDIEINTLETVTNPPNVTLNLNCTGAANNPNATWTNVQINQPQSLLFPLGTVLDENCVFYVDESLFFAEAVSSAVQVSKIPVYFGSPSMESSPYIQNNTIPVTPQTTAVTNPIGYVQLTLSCASSNNSVPIEVEVNAEGMTYAPTPYMYGLCMIIINSDDPIFQGPPVFFEISYQLSFGTVPAAIYLNQSFVISIDTISVVPSNLTTNLYLNCSNQIEYAWIDLPLNENLTLTAPAQFTTSGLDCVFQTESSPVFDAAEQPVIFENLKLYFVDPVHNSDYYQQNQTGIELAVNVSTISMLNPVGYVNATLQCISGFKSDLILDINVEQTVDLPADVIGVCVLTPIYSIYDGPKTIVFNVFVNLTLTSVPSTIYVGQNFSLTIDSSGTSDITATVQLFCDSTLATEWPSQPVNTPLNLTIPDTLTPSANCYLTTMPNDFQVPAPNVNVVLSNLQLKFVLPTQTNYNQTDQISIELIAEEMPTLVQNVTVLLFCASPPVNLFIATNTSEITTIDVPQDAKGLCLLSVPAPPPGFNQPNPVTLPIYIYWNLTLSDYPSTIYTGQNFNITINPAVPMTPPARLYLNCGGIIEQTWSNVPLNSTVELSVFPTLSPSSGCYFETLMPDPYIINAQSTTISLEKIPMFIDPPVNNQNITIPNSFALNITTPTNTSIAYQNQALLTCGLSVLNIDFTTNLVQTISYNDTFYGPCTISVPLVSPAYEAPTDVNIYLKFNLLFVKAPNQIVIGEKFQVEIDGVGNVPQSLAMTNLTLVCGGAVVQTWEDIPFGLPTILTVRPDVPYAGVCEFVTAANGDYFNQTESPVLVTYIPSPFGGNMFYISPEQQTIFVQSVTVAPSTGIIDLTFENI